MSRLCLTAAVLAIVSFAAAERVQQQQDLTTLPQDTVEDIRLLMDRSPCVPCAYCVSYNIPMFGPLNLNVSFTSNTKLRVLAHFFDQTATCDNIEYRIDTSNGQKELVIPKQSTDCIGILVLSYVRPVSRKLGLDRNARDGFRRWLTTFDQCAGNMHP